MSTPEKTKLHTRQKALLGIETSGETCAVGLHQNGRVIATLAYSIPNIHSHVLAGLIESILSTAKLGYEDLKAVAISAGPGSFTGLRIGYSLAKGIAHAATLPLIEVPTLDILAHQCGERSRPVLAVIDARRGEVFAALHQWKKQTCQKIIPDTLIPVEKINTMCESAPDVTGQLPGDLKNALLRQCNGARWINDLPGSPQMWALLQLGISRMDSKHPLGNLSEAEPYYMRTFKGVL